MRATAAAPRGRRNTDQYLSTRTRCFVPGDTVQNEKNATLLESALNSEQTLRQACVPPRRSYSSYERRLACDALLSLGDVSIGQGEVLLRKFLPLRPAHRGHGEMSLTGIPRTRGREGLPIAVVQPVQSTSDLKGPAGHSVSHHSRAMLLSYTKILDT
jgi:hypothetical protein